MYGLFFRLGGLGVFLVFLLCCVVGVGIWVCGLVLGICG